MTFRFARMRYRALLTGAIVCSMAAAAQPAAGAPQVPVDFTVHETFGSAPGKMISSNINGCPSATVKTVGPAENNTGVYTTFTGTKVINCGSGNTISLSYRARSSSCEVTDSGTWKVTGGTGIFASAKGQGQLVGTHTLGKGFGTFCENDGINDHYSGRLKL